jgi:RF-1 domain
MPYTRDVTDLPVHDHPACLDDETLLRQCVTGRSRSSGPGGQHRNKVETAVTLTHTPSGVTGQASERRSQIENKKRALRRLRLNLAVAVRRPTPDGDARSALWRSRTRGGQISINPKHHDYASLLAEALDCIAACGFDPKKAALRLEVTPSQLIKLVKLHPPALEMWNRQRGERQEHTLH